jgi:hypothetical protein
VPLDFCVAGAPKSGTTALFDYLSRHPAVFMPGIKEPNFFSSDLKTKARQYSADEYLALFGAARPGQLTGEASAIYLYSAVAMPRLMQHSPGARVIVMLRNPVDAAHSLHAARWNLGHENLANFQEAWSVQEARLKGERMPAAWPDRATLQYGPIYRYAAQVRRVLECVPAAQRHFMIYEEFFAEPQRHYARLLAFLGLPPQPEISFARVNPSIGPRSHAVDRWLRNPPQWLRALYSPLRPLFHAARLKPVALVRSLNSTPRRNPPMGAAFRAELEQYFADDVAELEGLLGRPLWRGDSLRHRGA